MFILTAFLLSLNLGTANADFRFASVEADQSSYTVGSKGILFAHIERMPTNKDSELYLSLLFQGEKVNVIQVSDYLAVALPKRFDLAGDFDLELSVLEQSKAEQKDLDSARVFYLSQIASLQKDLDAENDPEARDILQQRIAVLQGRVSALTDRMDSTRSLLEVDHLTVAIDPALKHSVQTSGVFSGQANRNPATYGVGEKAAFTFHPNTGFNGPDGPKENVFLTKVDGQAIGQAWNAGTDYTISTAAFLAANIGGHVAGTTFFVRSQKQADSLRNAKTQSSKRIQDLTKLRDSAENEVDRVYYNLKISELNGVVSAITAQLNAILLEVGNLSIPFTVTN
ncbi:MAG: hypothetical protein ACXVBL_05150 [Bdellovibrionota bacterium]